LFAEGGGFSKSVRKFVTGISVGINKYPLRIFPAVFLALVLLPSEFFYIFITPKAEKTLYCRFK
jgi:hypothetical protein